MSSLHRVLAFQYGGGGGEREEGGREEEGERGRKRSGKKIERSIDWSVD